MAEAMKTFVTRLSGTLDDMLTADSTTGKMQIIMLNACPVTGTDRWVNVAHKRSGTVRYFLYQRVVPGQVSGELRDPLHFTTCLILEVGDTLQAQGELTGTIDLLISYLQGVA